MPKANQDTIQSDSTPHQSLSAAGLSASAFLPPAPGSMLDVVQRLAAAERVKDALDTAALAQKREFAIETALDRAFTRANEQCVVMHQLAVTLPVLSLADAAAALAVAFAEVDGLAAHEVPATGAAMRAAVGALRWLIVSCLPVVATAAGLDMADLMHEGTIDLVRDDLAAAGIGGVQ